MSLSLSQGSIFSFYFGATNLFEFDWTSEDACLTLWNKDITGVAIDWSSGTVMSWQREEKPGERGETEWVFWERETHVLKKISSHRSHHIFYSWGGVTPCRYTPWVQFSITLFPLTGTAFSSLAIDSPLTTVDRVFTASFTRNDNNVYHTMANLDVYGRCYNFLVVL